MVYGALDCMNNSDFKKSKLHDCGWCVYYLRKITKCTGNLKSTVLVWTYRPSK